MSRFVVWNDPIETTTAIGHYEPDPDWVFVDANGHTHQTVDGQWPTLMTAHNEWIDADGDDRYETAYTCLECGKEIEPGTIYVPPSPYRTFVPGMKHYSIDGVEVSPEEFMERTAHEQHPPSLRRVPPHPSSR